MSEFIERAVDFEPLPDSERASDNQSDGRTLEGYAAVFDQDTEINSWEGHFMERISRGAFRKTLKEGKPIMQYDHGHDIRFGNLPIGVYEDVREDKHGLRVRGRLFQHAEPIREAIEAGAVTGMSFKFRVVRDSWTDDKGNAITDRNELMDKLYNAKKGDKPLRRTIKEIKLREAGPVTTPAYAQTTVGVRSMTDDQRKRAIEDLTAGFDASEERTLEEVIAEFGFTPEELLEAAERGENPFAAKKAEGKGDDKAKAEKCDKCTDKAKCEKHKKTSSGDGKKPPFEKKSADTDDTEAPAVGSEAADSAREDQDEAAQAGTSSGMSSNSRERALRLLDI